MAKNDKKGKTKSGGSSKPADKSVKASDTPKAENDNSRRKAAIAIAVGIILILLLVLIGFLLASATNNELGSSYTSSSTSSSGSSEESVDTSSNGSSSDETISSSATSADSSTSSTQTGDVSSTSTSETSSSESEEGNSDTATDDIDEEVDGDAESLPKSYTETAEVGGSVSWLARRAMYAYMRDYGLSLDTPGQRLFFEVTLTNASSPTWLTPGEARTFDVSTLDSIFSQAQALTGNQLSAWAYQAASVSYI